MKWKSVSSNLEFNPRWRPCKQAVNRLHSSHHARWLRFQYNFKGRYVGNHISNRVGCLPSSLVLSLASCETTAGLVGYWSSASSFKSGYLFVMYMRKDLWLKKMQGIIGTKSIQDSYPGGITHQNFVSLCFLPWRTNACWKILMICLRSQMSCRQLTFTSLEVRPDEYLQCLLFRIRLRFWPPIDTIRLFYSKKKLYVCMSLEHGKFATV